MSTRVGDWILHLFERPGKSKFPLEGPVEDGGQQGVEFGGGLGLEALQRVDFGLQGVEFVDDSSLFS